MEFLADFIKKVWRRAASPEFLFVFVAVWTALILFSTLPLGDLSGYDDAAYAHEAKTMLQSGDFWTLSLNGAVDFDKPPLFIWLLAASFKIFGATDFAAKLPAALLGWATVVTVYFLTKELFADEPEESPQKKWLPALAMLSMATTQYFLKYASHAMTDVPFTFFFALAVYFYVWSWKNNSLLMVCGIAVGLATLTRSPMGLFPLGIVVFHLVFTRRFKSLFSFYFVGCLLFAVVIPLIWYWREYEIFGEVFISRHFANILGHSASTAPPRAGWQQFLRYFEYLFLIVKLYIPWFLLMFYGLFLALRKIFRSKSFTSVETLLLIWFFVVLILFSLAESKVLRYILPVFPAFAILSAYSLSSLLSPKRLSKFSQAAVALLILAAFITVGFPNYLPRAGDMRTLAPVSDAATAPEEKILLYTSGEYQWNYETQLLWYGNRLCAFSKDMKEVESLLSESKETVVIMDKRSFADLTEQTDVNIRILGESENFVCFRN